MDFQVWTAPTAIAQLRPAWQALFDRCPEASPFLSWEWASCWWTHFGQGKQPYILSLTEGDDLVALAPLMLDPGLGRLTFLSSEETTDYADLLALPWAAEAAARAALAELQASSHPAVLEPLPETSPLLDLVRTQGGLMAGARAEPLETCPRVNLPANWDAYLASLSKTDRHELRRKLRRAQSSGQLFYHVAAHPAEVRATLPIFFRLHQSSGNPKKAAFLQPHMQAFFTEVSLALAARGWLRLGALHLDGEPIGALLAFDRGSTVALYNSGYDPRYRSISPGIVLLAYDLQAAIERGRTTYDFLRGDEPYKYDFGARDQFVWSVRLRGNGRNGPESATWAESPSTSRPGGA